MPASPLGPAIVLTGPPCAGKSTASAALMPPNPDEGVPLALLDLDAVRWQVKGGFLNPMAEIPPSADALEQWQLAVDICGDSARRYAAVGYGLVIDAPGIYPDGIVPWEAYTHRAWARALEGVDWRLVVLLPDVELVCARAVARAGFRQPPEGLLRMIHAGIAAWRSVDGVPVLDTTTLTVGETVAAIRRAAGWPAVGTT
ncbi:MAG TPA: AAA family ATPase [Acidimicrobiales bacterium]|nr:AAA family ATPase [Acidimicrobiales bacterium]